MRAVAVFQGLLEADGTIIRAIGNFDVTREYDLFKVTFPNVNVSKSFVLATSTFRDVGVAQPVTVCRDANRPSEMFFTLSRGYGLSFRVEVPEQEDHEAKPVGRS